MILIGIWRMYQRETRLLQKKGKGKARARARARARRGWLDQGANDGTGEK